MEECVVNGIVLTVSEYKEKDVLVNLFTVELGKITAVLKGVKGASAKLKFAAQPFCFGEWVLVKKGDFYTVTSVTAYDLFYDVTKNYNNFVIASSFLEICNEILRPNILAEKIFVSLLNTLKNLVYEDTNAYLCAIKFYQDVIYSLGYGLSYTTCGNCGTQIKNEIYLSYAHNDFCCAGCCNGAGIEITRQMYNSLKIIDATPIDRLNTIKFKNDMLFNCVILLKNHMELLLNFKIRSLTKLCE